MRINKKRNLNPELCGVTLIEAEDDKVSDADNYAGAGYMSFRPPPFQPLQFQPLQFQPLQFQPLQFQPLQFQPFTLSTTCRFDHLQIQPPQIRPI